MAVPAAGFYNPDSALSVSLRSAFSALAGACWASKLHSTSLLVLVCQPASQPAQGITALPRTLSRVAALCLSTSYKRSLLLAGLAFVLLQSLLAQRSSHAPGEHAQAACALHPDCVVHTLQLRASQLPPLLCSYCGFAAISQAFAAEETAESVTQLCADPHDCTAVQAGPFSSVWQQRRAWAQAWTAWQA